jgi:FkbM family methyltransferase
MLLFSFIKNCIQVLFPTYFRNKTFKNFQQTFDSKNVDQEFIVLKHLLSKNASILDLGANNGEYCFFFQEIIQAKEIIAFEPIPSLYRKLIRNFPKIQVFPFAISASSGSSELHIPYINEKRVETRAKLDDLKELGETKTKRISVEIRTLDDLFFDKNSKFDFIKIDVEGHEMQAIRGASKVIKRDSPILMVEIEERHHPSDFWSIIQEIASFGYACYFYDSSQNKMVSIEFFDLQIHQNLTNTNHYYIHNLLFFPLDFSVDKLNISLQNTL